MSSPEPPDLLTPATPNPEPAVPEISRSIAGWLGCMGGFAFGAFLAVVVTLVRIVFRVRSQGLSESTFWVVYVLSVVVAVVGWRVGLRMWDLRYGNRPEVPTAPPGETPTNPER